MTSFITINSTTASPKTAELLPAAAGSELSVCTALKFAAIIPAAAARTDIPDVSEVTYFVLFRSMPRRSAYSIVMLWPLIVVWNRATYLSHHGTNAVKQLFIEYTVNKYRLQHGLQLIMRVWGLQGGVNNYCHASLE